MENAKMEIQGIVKDRVGMFIDVLYDDLKDIIKEDVKQVENINGGIPEYDQIKKVVSEEMFKNLLSSVQFKSN
jgi:hypothetical protein